MDIMNISDQKIQERLSVLKQNEIFSQTSDELLLRLVSLFTEIDFEPGKTIVKKNAPCKSIYLIMKGTVRVHDGGHVFGMLEKGHVFGEYSLIDTQPRSASVTTIAKTKVLCLNNEDLEKDKELRIAVIAVIVKVLTSRLRSHNELEEMLTKAYTKIRLQKSQLELEKKKIEKQNQEIKQILAELREAKAEVEQQHKELKKEKRVIEEQNAEIMLKNEEINAQNEEIRAQRDELEIQRDMLLGQQGKDNKKEME